MYEHEWRAVADIVTRAVDRACQTYERAKRRQAITDWVLQVRPEHYGDLETLVTEVTRIYDAID